jgi:aryl-alcohol dehydrogenase-like predicted oxidoreductase
MESRRLGSTGLRVSSVGLGTMTWGRDTDEHEAAEQLKVFLDAGGTLLDTAATYSGGGALDIIGGLLREEVSRDEIVLAARSGVSHGRIDASRGALLASLDETLIRLGTDHLDLWLVQAPDPGTPTRETASTLARAVASGRVRYVGLANHAAWQLAQVATMLEGEPGLACAQTEYSLLNRSAETELFAATTSLGVGVVAWSPLGRGVLSAKYRHSVPADSRAASPHLRGFVEPYLTAHARGVVEAVATAADGLGRAPVEIALAWARDAPGVSSVVVGARTPAQLRGSLTADDLDLPDEIRDALDEITTRS